MPPPCLLKLLKFLGFEGGVRAWSYGVSHCFPPSLHLDTAPGLVLLCPFLPPAVLSCFDGGGYCYAPSFPSILSYSVVKWWRGGLSFDGGVEGMVLRGLVLLCPLSP